MASARGERACVSSPSRTVIFVVSPRESGVSKRYHPFHSSSPRLPTRLQLAKCPSTVTSLIPFFPDLFFKFFPFSFDQRTLQMIDAASTRQDGIRHTPFLMLCVPLPTPIGPRNSKPAVGAAGCTITRIGVSRLAQLVERVTSISAALRRYRRVRELA